MFSFLLRVIWVAYRRRVLAHLVCWLLPVRTTEGGHSKVDHSGFLPKQPYPALLKAFSLCPSWPYLSLLTLGCHCAAVYFLYGCKSVCAWMSVRVYLYAYKCERAHMYMCLCMWELSGYGAEHYNNPCCQNWDGHVFVHLHMEVI